FLVVIEKAHAVEFADRGQMQLSAKANIGTEGDQFAGFGRTDVNNRSRRHDGNAECRIDVCFAGWQASGLPRSTRFLSRSERSRGVSIHWGTVQEMLGQFGFVIMRASLELVTGALAQVKLFVVKCRQDWAGIRAVDLQRRKHIRAGRRISRCIQYRNLYG